MPSEKPKQVSLFEETPLFAELEGYTQPRKENKTRVPAKGEKTKTKKTTTVQDTKSNKPKQSVKQKQQPAKRVVSPTVEKIEEDAILLSVREMCHLLKISRATLVRMDTAGKIPGRMKLGGSVRFHRATVERWLESLIATHPVP